MKIRRLEVKGFCSLADIIWRPGDLNVLIGPNASGKSNVLRVLDMLSASARGGLSKYIQREGGMEPLVWDGSVDRIEIECAAENWDDGVVLTAEFQYQLILERLWKSSAYRVGLEVLVGTDHITEEPRAVKVIERNQRHATLASDERPERKALEEFDQAETILSLMTGPFVPSRLALWFHLSLTSWAVYQHVHLSVIREPAVVSMETQVSADAENLIPVLHTLYSSDRDFKRQVNLAMKAAFGDEFEELIFPPAADQRVQLRVRWKSLKREQSAADLPDGAIRFLFLLAVLANPNRPGLIAIDEPETGLHPSMMPIVAEYAAEAATRSQVILTTHSPALLDALGKHNPTVTVTEWQQGKTQLKVLSGDELQYWLKQFSLGDIYRSGQLETMG